VISYIIGTVKHKTENSLIILVQGLGYEVFVNNKIFEKYQVGAETEFFLHQNVREDALTLFGFEAPDELNLFKKLLSISGIGPKSALGILEIASVEEIVTSIQNNDPQVLTKVSGVGKKTAERVVLELRNKIGLSNISSKTAENFSSTSDEIDALVALGYPANHAREALHQVPSEIKGASARVKEALKYLGK